ncbi:MAG TPA: hypothetical protein VMB50_00305 [Myxococcales bacterium]|nr:hypothetical protein [Myxococcales bacterium]
MIDWVLAVWLGALPGKAPQLIATPGEADLLCHDLVETPWSSDLPADPVDRAAFEADWSAHREAASRLAYAVEVPAGLFRFARYDDGELWLDDRWALLGAGGGLAVFPSGDGAWGLAATPAQAHRAYRLWRRGRARLFIAFHPSPDGCNGVPYARSHSLAVAPGWLELRSDDGTFVLSGAGDWAPPPPPAEARVRAAPPVLVAGDADVGAVERAVEADAGLQRCYSQALAASPDAGGDLVIEAQIGPPGVVQTSRVALDGIADPALTSCLRQRFQALQLTGAGAGAHLYVPLELGGR